MTRLFHVSDVHFGREDRAAVDWFAARVREEQPDAVIVTGDLTMQARAREFSAAAQWLKGLGRPVTVEVGNHDLPWFNLWARFVTPYKRYHALERMIERPLDAKGVAVVPLKTTARFQWRLNWSKGYVSTRALRASLALVEAVPPGGLVFVACHHPLVLDVYKRQVLYGSARFLLEFLRQPDAGLEHLWWGLTMGQTLSLPMVLAGLWLVARPAVRMPAAS